MGIQPSFGHKVASGEVDAVVNPYTVPCREGPSADKGPAVNEIATQRPMVLQRRLSRRFSIKAPSDRDDRGWTPLHVAARRGDLAEVRRLIDAGANVNEPSTGPKSPGGTPLHNAAKERNRKAVRFLLENGAFLAPDMTDGRFNPPLHYCPGLHWAYKVRDKLVAQETKNEGDQASNDDM